MQDFYYGYGLAAAFSYSKQKVRLMFKTAIFVLGLFFSIHSSASLIKMSVDFTATEFNGLHDAPPSPENTITGSFSWIFDDTNINRSSPLSYFKVRADYLALKIDGRSYFSEEATLSTGFRFGEFSYIMLGADLNLDNVIIGGTDDFRLDICAPLNCLFANNVNTFTYSSSEYDNIFSSKEIQYSIRFNSVPAPPSILLLFFGLFALLTRKSWTKESSQ